MKLDIPKENYDSLSEEQKAELKNYYNFSSSDRCWHSRKDIGYDTAFNTAWKELLDCALLCKTQNRTVSGQFIYTYQLSELMPADGTEEITETIETEAPPKKEKAKFSKVIELTAEKVRAFTSAPSKPHTTRAARTSLFTSGISNRANFTQRNFDDAFWDNLMATSLAETVRAAR